MPAGRPKGSKNKKLGLNRDYLLQLFKRTDFEPGLFLIGVASGTDRSGDFDHKDRIRAAQILMNHTYDKPQRESQQALIDELRQLHQEKAPVYEIVYEQDTQASEFVPPEAGTTLATG